MTWGAEFSRKLWTNHQVQRQEARHPAKGSLWSKLRGHKGNVH
eukprot:CAMPEP_0174368076 /NCGR_PEP_ID=MMETSP0811_2-20130205/87708_1 /TAXON_ID=73025 ORGANISM="Eutreptiella gymnastica-like, Strain CCMP1594" /NCGR_SAMPLE_ID=MMETSP0811_2 /ASSEMBLY_ACC=CAM_ASM_000667 /LENGTH=42 /DNA_ID= /DNA_START= /DNA_END= /DNA_ORIENTATION=